VTAAPRGNKGTQLFSLLKKSQKKPRAGRGRPGTGGPRPGAAQFFDRLLPVLVQLCQLDLHVLEGLLLLHPIAVTSFSHALSGAPGSLPAGERPAARLPKGAVSPPEEKIPTACSVRLRIPFTSVYPEMPEPQHSLTSEVPMIRFSCPTCGTAVSAPEECAGRSAPVPPLPTALRCPAQRARPRIGCRPAPARA
jgi:hypothetical protein